MSKKYDPVLLQGACGKHSEYSILRDQLFVVLASREKFGWAEWGEGRGGCVGTEGGGWYACHLVILRKGGGSESTRMRHCSGQLPRC